MIPSLVTPSLSLIPPVTRDRPETLGSFCCLLSPETARKLIAFNGLSRSLVGFVARVSIIRLAHDGFPRDTIPVTQGRGQLRSKAERIITPAAVPPPQRSSLNWVRFIDVDQTIRRDFPFRRFLYDADN